MPKENEIAYIYNLAKIHNVPHTEVEEYHLKKPFSDVRCGYYLMDIGQIMMMLPPAPARILDLGVGSGWTSAMLARNGYSVLGLDIAPDMIAIAQRHTAPHLNLHFEVHDYESSIDFGLFDAAVIYDALHHAIDEASVIKNVFCCLKQNGIFITIEPGVGHSTSPDSLEAMKKFGTTEKDMEYSRQAKLMREAGFGSIRQYLRLSQLSLEDVATESGNIKQREHFEALSFATVNGLTSLVVAVKDANDSGNKAESITLLTTRESFANKKEVLVIKNIPFPPLELRQIVGPTDDSAFDNPDGRLIWGDLAYGSLQSGEAYQAIFDFGCGCGRNARQLMLQNSPPQKYVGIDISPTLIEWCKKVLTPLDNNFKFLHHDVYSPNPSYVPPNSGQSNKMFAPFPSENSQFSLFIAHSVFTHLYYEQTEYYLREASRILKDNGLMKTTWFFINKKLFPILQPYQHCIYVNHLDPTQAVYYDWEQFLFLIHSLGLAVVDVVWTKTVGFQSEVFLGKSNFFKDISPELSPPNTIIGYGLQENLALSQPQLQQTQEELERVESQLQQALATITAMETSKFWKLRTQWFKLKQLLKLKP